MMNRRVLIGGLVVAVAMTAVASVGAVGAANNPSRRTVLTFDGPVALPGVTLAAGRYTFEVATASGNPVVLVKNKQGSVYMHFTEPVERPAGMPRDVAVRFGESGPGMAPPIIEWYPTGELIGHRFIYSRN